VPTLLTIAIKTEQDIVNVRKQVRMQAEQLQFSLIKQTKIVTAASELARNIFKYANVGTLEISLIHGRRGTGLQLVFKDQGPGIPDIEQAMSAGFSTGKGLGLGLSGAQRLVDEFNITSHLGKGTCVRIILWK
jgi:serine/threonine-protein kinase RsbT